MRPLTSLRAEWLRDPSGRRVGVVFDCPAAGCDRAGCRLPALFSNPVGGGPAATEDEASGMRLGWWLQTRWERAGGGLDDMTLSPSLHFKIGNVTHWHGWIRAGQVEG